MKYRPSMMYTSSVGKEARSAAAICRLYGVTSEPVVLLSATVTGHDAGSLMMKTAKRKSFQIEVNCQIAATTNAGAETGRMTDQYVLSIPARSIRAASISSSGMVA